MPSLGKVEIRPLKYVDLFLTRCGWSNLYISEKEIMALKTLRIVTKRRAWLELWKNWTLLVVKLNIRRKSSSRQSAPLWMQLLIKLSFSLFYFQTDREEVQALPRCLSIIHLHFASTLRQWWWLRWGCCCWSSDQYLKMSCLLLGPEGGWPLNSKTFILLLDLVALILPHHLGKCNIFDKLWGISESWINKQCGLHCFPCGYIKSMKM